jgi:replicative DNA helicase
MNHSNLPAPQNLAAELSVLGGLLADPSSIGQLAEILEPSDFYLPSHGELFAFIASEYRARRIPTIIEVEDFLKSNAGKGNGITASTVRDAIGDAPPSSVITAQHARLVKEDSRRRALFSKLREAETAIYDREAPAEIAARLASFIAKMAARDGRAFETVSEVSTRVLKQIEQAWAGRREGGKIAPNAIATGFGDIDSRIGGLFRRNLFVVAGRPGMGKSAFGCAVAANVARAGIGVGFVSAESPTDSIFRRMLSRETEIENRHFHLGTLKDADAGKITAAIGRFYTDQLFFLDIERRWSAIRAKVENLKLECPGLGLVVIDYAQLLEVEGHSDRGRHLEVGQVSAESKAFAMELDLAVLLLAQVNRAVETRQDKRPLLADLRESGNLEQDADTVAMLYRPAYYDEETEYPRRCEFIIRKSRDGVTGMIPLHFDDETVSFSDWI